MDIKKAKINFRMADGNTIVIVEFLHKINKLEVSPIKIRLVDSCYILEGPLIPGRDASVSVLEPV